MSTAHGVFSPEQLSDFVQNLQEWPATAWGSTDYELGVSPFTTFYFSYESTRSTETAQLLVDIHEEFEALTGVKYETCTHPGTSRPHPYGSKRLPDLRQFAKEVKADKHFSFDVSDSKNTASSPVVGGYFWRNPAYINDADDTDRRCYSHIQLYQAWQWWLDNSAAWRRFLFSAIDRLKPQQVYSGFAMANPPAFGTRSEVSVWDRSLAMHFYGLDTDYPFSMGFGLTKGIRTQTWGFFLSDSWRKKLHCSREQVRLQLRHPRITITDFENGQWIELGDTPQLYPVSEGIPELPVRLNELLRPIRNNDLDLVGSGEWDGDPNVRFTQCDSRRWLGRFDEESDWPSAEAHMRPGAPSDDNQ